MSTQPLKGEPPKMSRFEEENKKRISFKEELEKDWGFENHPKRDILFALAWDYGHSCGFSEVRNYYNDLAALLDSYPRKVTDEDIEQFLEENTELFDKIAEHD